MKSVLLNVSLSIIFVTSANAQQQGLSLNQSDDGIEIRVGDDLFTRFNNTDENKPMLYPVMGPGQIPMTRGYPMDPHDGEATDHPHHKSIWIGHEVNGHIDCWANRSGRIKFDSFSKIDSDACSFTVKNHWMEKKTDKVLVTESTRYDFGVEKDVRWLDATITFTATNGDFTFNDTKEGLFAIRTHPDLRLSPNKKGGVLEVFGNAINSEGDAGKAVWGKAAKWVNYWGTIDDQKVGIAIFDHPSNLRHPTHWHARDYGLVAANPFGLHHFTGAEKGAGEYTIKSDESLTLRYRMLFYSGEHDEGKISGWYEAFAN